MFFGHCHRTRFRDSFCLAGMFEMTVYLLTYLLTLPYSSILLPSIEVSSCPSACTLGLLKHFHRYCLKADKVSKNAGTGKIEYF